MNATRPARRSMALARTRPIAAPTSPAIWALWPHAWTAPVDRSASGCPATTSASSSPTSANVGPGPAPPAASARTSVIASPVRGARPSWRNFVSTSADVLSSLKPSSGWRRIASPTATISSAWRSIASSTRCLSSSRVMGSPRSSFIKFASGLGAPAPAGPAARTTTSSPLDRRVWRRISEPRAAGARQFRSTPGELNNDRGEGVMQAATAVAEILKREGVRFLIGYPVSPIIEAGAEADIRTIIVRQERTGLHMADAVSRISSGDRIGVFAMQHGPGSENAFGGVAQAYGDSVPIVVLPGGYPRRITNIQPNFNSFLNFQHVTKWCEQVIVPDAVVDAMRRAFTQVKNGRPRPVLIEFPVDLLREDVPEPIQYTPAPRLRSAPDPRDVSRVADALVAAQRPVIYAGQGVHYARAWQVLRELAELLEAPVTTSLQGKSAFPETHPLSLGSGGRSISKQLHHFLTNADLILGIGCSFSATNYGVTMPKGKRIAHATLDPTDINKDVASELALVGDAGLTLQALLVEVKDRLKGGPRGRFSVVTQEIKNLKSEWLAQWTPRLTADTKPLSPYRVIWDLMHTVDVANTIITPDAGSPRDQISPFWEPVAPLSYIGWGKTTQLGYGLGLAMGAKLAAPDKLCVNVWGDAAIGFTGMDFETAVRERIPILSVLLNNFSMAIELKIMKTATAKYRSTDISGDYAAMARAFGGHGERVTEPGEIVPAIRRGIRRTQEGTPALLEFITEKAEDFSMF